MIVRFGLTGKQVDNCTEKKIAIFDTTLELVNEKGFHGCPMSAVAKNAGVAAGTIYHHFESKDELMCELFTYVGEKLQEVMFAGEEEEMSYKKRFINFWMNLYHFYIQHPAYPRFYQQFVHSPYYPYREQKGVSDGFTQKIFSFINEGIEQGMLQHVKPEIIGVLTHNNIMTSARIHGFGKIPLGKEELNQIVEMLWKGISRE